MAELVTSIRKLRKRSTPTSVDQQPALPADPAQARLWKLAAQSVKGEDTYTKDQIIALISQNTGVTSERAEHGFTMMVEAQAINVTLNPNLFYLGISTPF